MSVFVPPSAECLSEVPRRLILALGLLGTGLGTKPEKETETEWNRMKGHTGKSTDYIANPNLTELNKKPRTKLQNLHSAVRIRPAPLKATSPIRGWPLSMAPEGG